MKPVILSGIQPSGRLHVGNYLGALKHFLDIQNAGSHECFFFIADLHSLTEEFVPSEKQSHIRDLALSYLAAGLTPKKSTLFIQSQVTAHSELSWILSTLTPMGELQRMTQFKDKSENGSPNVGLFTYPVLMAADILLYKSAAVPVGDDQDQHLELTRTLARKFNTRFGETFLEPKALHTATPRVMSLDDPMKKMSKSRPAGCLFIDDSPEEIQKKVMAAVTDSGSEVRFDEAEKPGIANLLRIASALSGETIPHLEERFKNVGYGIFKKDVATMIADHFATYRKEKERLSKKPEKALKIFAAGAKKARKVAEETMKLVHQRVGLV